MTHHIFYGDIRNQIVSQLFKKSENILKIERKLNFENGENIFEICSEAARIFYSIQNLSGCCDSLSLPKAIKHYANTVISQLANGIRPTNLDLVIMASKAIKKLA